MNYQLLGRSGLRVSDLCLDTMTFGEEWGRGTAKDEARKIYDAYREAGGNFLDIANLYTGGTSKRFVGEFIANHRQEVVVATKYTNYAGGDVAPHANVGGNQLQDNIGSLRVTLSPAQVARLDKTSAISLGFPHDFFALELVRNVVSGGFADRIKA